MDKRFRISSPEKTIVKTNMKYDTKELKRIKVKLDRKIPTPSEPKQVIHTVDKPEDIKIRRKEGEGKRPIFDRSDIIVNKEETEQRTVSTYSPNKSPGRSQNNSHKSSDNYTSFGSDSPRRGRESPRRSSRYSRSPKREHKSSKSNRRSSSLHRESNRPSSSRRDVTSSRNRSRSRDDGRRSRRSRSRSRSPRREFARRRNSRSPNERDRRRYERRNYGPNERDRRRNRSRSPRYGRSSPRRRSRSRPPHMAPIDPTTVIPLIIPPFYGAEEAVWFPPPLRPPMLIPPGVPMHPRGMYRGPFPGMRPPMPGRPPFMPPRQVPFRQVRPPNRPQLQ